MPDRRSTAVLICGFLLFGIMAVVARLDARVETTVFLLLLMAAGGVYLTALALVVRRPPRSQRLLVACLILAAVWRVPLMTTDPLVSDDVYRYVWDGRVQRHGHNPYAVTPRDADLSHLQTDLTRHIDPTSAVLPTIYPPAAQLLFRGVTALHESVQALVIVVVLCDLVTTLLLLRWLRVTNRSAWWVLAYAWHPLVTLEGAGGGHIDLIGALLVLAVAYSLTVKRPLAAALMLALAFSVKFLPLVLAPLLWRRVAVRHAVAAVGLVAVLYLPFLDGGSGIPIGSLGTYVAQWRFNGPLFQWLASWLGSAGALVAAIVGGLGVAAWARARLPIASSAAWAWPMAVTLACAPAVYPWYLVWLTPFLDARASWPLVVWTLASLLTYVVWASQTSGVGWVLPGWVVPLEYGLVVLTGLWLLRHQRMAGSQATAVAS